MVKTNVQDISSFSKGQKNVAMAAAIQDVAKKLERFLFIGIAYYGVDVLLNHLQKYD